MSALGETGLQEVARRGKEAGHYYDFLTLILYSVKNGLPLAPPLEGSSGASLSDMRR
jgi:hypothetical protein